jgi:hypothetical protein
MSWIVILSDERSEESKEPYGRQPGASLNLHLVEWVF